MGCHTWFYNKITDIPNDHISKLRKKAAKEIKGFYLYTCSYDQWYKDRQDDIDGMMSLGELSEEDKSWLETLKRTQTKEYYMERRKEYEDRLKILEDPTTPKEDLLNIFVVHFYLFNGSLDNSYYNLSDFGWGDNYRVYGYPGEKFYDAYSAINFLENYDDRLIACDMQEGMCDEIKKIIKDFFNKYPNGMIYYG